MIKPDKQRIKFEKYCMDKLKTIQDILLLNDYFPITLKRLPVTNLDSRATSTFLYPYKYIEVSYSEEMFEEFKEGKYDDIVSTLVHEMCHPITDPLYNIATEVYKTRDEVKNIRESLTDHIANVVLKNIKIK